MYRKLKKLVLEKYPDLLLFGVWLIMIYFGVMIFGVASLMILGEYGR